MKKLILLFAIIGFMQLESKAQEKYGSALNLGIGIGGYSGYYGYIGRSLPVLSANYEFDIAPNFTLAPFVRLYSYTNRYLWSDANNTSKYYNYRETVIPIGVKGTYYFDEIFSASSPWDFYAAGSLGMALVRTHWDNDYQGDKNVYKSGRSLFLDIHVGVEYHFNQKIGGFVDFSSGVSTIGIAFH